MLLISVCVLCLEALSLILWAFWGAGEGEGRHRFGAFKRILNVEGCLGTV